MLATNSVHSGEDHEAMPLYTQGFHSLQKSRVRIMVGTEDPVQTWTSPALSIRKVLLGAKYFLIKFQFI